MRAAVWVGAVAILLSGGYAAGQDKKPEVIAKLDGHRGGVAFLTFNPNKPLVATGSGNGVVKLWETKTGDVAFRIDPSKQNGARVNHLGFSADGWLLSTSSKNALVVWDLKPPEELKKDPKKDESKLPVIKDEPKEPLLPPGPRIIPTIFEDALGFDPIKIGTVTGNGRRAYFSATEGARVAINSRSFSGRVGADTNDELKSVFTPWAVSAINDDQSELVAMYGSLKSADRTEPVIAFVGLGDPKIIGRGAVRAPTIGRTVSISFAPDNKWLVACNGEDLMYWRVPGSQVVAGDPKVYPGGAAFVAAAGPNGHVAFASPPEDGKTVKVTIADISGSQPKVIAVYSTEIERVSALAFSSDGTILAVGDDVEGVVQLWSIEKK